MAMNPGAIMAGAVTGVAANHLQQAVHNTFGKETDPVVELLKEIRDGVNPKQKDSINESFQLAIYPNEYIIPDDFHGRSHVCIFLFGTNINIRLDGVFGGTYTKTFANSGWYQIDVPGRLSLASGTNTPVMISYRDEELGVAF